MEIVLKYKIEKILEATKELNVLVDVLDSQPLNEIMSKLLCGILDMIGIPEDTAGDICQETGECSGYCRDTINDILYEYIFGDSLLENCVDEMIEYIKIDNLQLQ